MKSPGTTFIGIFIRDRNAGANVWKLAGMDLLPGKSPERSGTTKGKISGATTGPGVTTPSSRQARYVRPRNFTLKFKHYNCEHKGFPMENWFSTLAGF